MSSVVLGYDESEGSHAALDAALTVAAKFEEQLVLVYAVGPPGAVGEEYRAHRDALTQMGRHALDGAVERARQAGVPTTVELVDAKPADALLSVAEKYDASVIVVGIVGESPLRSIILGSTPNKLLHLSNRPVLCVPRSTDDD